MLSVFLPGGGGEEWGSGRGGLHKAIIFMKSIQKIIREHMTLLWPQLVTTLNSTLTAPDLANSLQFTATKTTTTNMDTMTFIHSY